MKIFKISIRIYIGIFILISLSLISYKTIITYSNGSALYPYNNQLLLEKFDEGILVNKHFIGSNISNDLEKLTELFEDNNILTNNTYIQNVSVHFDQNNKDNETPIIESFRMHLFEPLNGYTDERYLSIRDNHEGKTQIDLNSSRGKVRMFKSHYLKNDASLRLLIRTAKEDFKNNISADCNSISVEVIDIIEAGSDFSIFEIYKSYEYGVLNQEVQYLGFKDNELNEIENIEEFQTNDTSVILKLSIRRTQETINYFVIMN